MKTLKTGTEIALMQGNMVVIAQPVPAAKTIESVAVQPRPMYQNGPSDVGEKADSIEGSQYSGARSS